MTKKDYILIVKAIRRCHMTPDYRDELVDIFCEVLKKDNARFDPDRFRAAIEKRKSIAQ